MPIRRNDVRPPLLLAAVALWVGVLALSGCASSAPRGSAGNARVYVITGASSGFGQGVALQLAAEHARMVLVARREGVLREVAAQVQSRGGEAIVFPADVADAQAMEAAAAAAVQRWGHIDVWINDAGVGAIGPFDAIPAADHARVVQTNVVGVINGSVAALHQFRRQGQGTLVNIGSIDSEVPLAYQSTYAASKAAVLSLGRSLNEEMRLAGLRRIKVATVMPWAADTPWWVHASNHSGHVPRMVAVDPADKVVRAIVRATKHPREEIPVGWKAHVAYWGHRVAPDVSERVSADVAHREQMEKAAPAPATSGAIFQPIEEGTGVEGGWRRVNGQDK